MFATGGVLGFVCGDRSLREFCLRCRDKASFRNRLSDPFI